MKISDSYLTKREQEIMEVLFRHGAMTANEIGEKLTGSPSNSTVRTQLRVLEGRGLLDHREEEGRFVYQSLRPAEEAGRGALQSVVETFFQGSILNAVAALMETRKLSPEEITELEKIVGDREEA
jgi:predicted transcriptional regulator